VLSCFRAFVFLAIKTKLQTIFPPANDPALHYPNSLYQISFRDRKQLGYPHPEVRLARSTSYWSANFYSDPDDPPRPSAPLRDLPPIAAQRFRMLRDTLVEIAGVTERVRFVLPNWKWTWEYSVPARKLCWIHVMETGLAGTFTISDEDARELGRIKLAAGLRDIIRDGQRTGPVTWCSLEFSDRKTIDGFLGLMKKKAAWVAAHPQESKVFRRNTAG
jgi:hypothetical protein